MMKSSADRFFIPSISIVDYSKWLSVIFSNVFAPISHNQGKGHAPHVTSLSEGRCRRFILLLRPLLLKFPLLVCLKASLENTRVEERLWNCSWGELDFDKLVERRADGGAGVSLCDIPVEFFCFSVPITISSFDAGGWVYEDCLTCLGGGRIGPLAMRSRWGWEDISKVSKQAVPVILEISGE